MIDHSNAIERLERIELAAKLLARYNSVTEREVTYATFKRNKKGQLFITLMYQNMENIINLNDKDLEAFRQDVITVENRKEAAEKKEKLLSKVRTKFNSYEWAILTGSKDSLLERLTPEEREVILEELNL